MRKIMLMSLLFVMSGSALAGWVKAGNKEIYSAYADPTTIRKTGNKVKIWTLLDFKTVQTANDTKPHMSVKDSNGIRLQGRANATT